MVYLSVYILILRSSLCFVLSVEELSAKVEDGKDEIRTLKRKHVNNVKVRFLFLHTVNLVITKKKKIYWPGGPEICLNLLAFQ